MTPHTRARTVNHRVCRKVNDEDLHAFTGCYQYIIVFDQEMIRIVLILLCVLVLFMLLNVSGLAHMLYDRDKDRWKSEAKCRDIVRELYPKCVFKKVRPSFLRYPETGHNLELDIKCEEMKLAIEYQGDQHYDITPYFHKTYDKFQKQQARDKFKERRCREMGIRLVCVPYTVTHSDMRAFISERIGYSK